MLDRAAWRAVPSSQCAARYLHREAKIQIAPVDPHTGSVSRVAIIAAKAGRAWQAASQAFTFGAASKSSVAGIA